MKNPEGIENHEISIDYVNTEGLWNRNEIENMDEIFFYSEHVILLMKVRILNQDPSLNAKIDMIGQNGKTLYRLN